MFRLTISALFALLSLGCAPSGAQSEYAIEQAPQPAPSELPSVSSNPELVTVQKLTGLEALNTWFAEKWANEVEIKNSDTPDLGKHLVLSVKAGDKDKVAVGILLNGSYGGEGKSLRMDFFNPGKETVKVAVGLFATGDRTYYESPVIEIARGWSSHALDLNSKQWKSEKSKWQFTEAPGNVIIEQLDVLIYTAKPITLDITYVSEPEKPAPAAEPKPVQKSTEGVSQPGVSQPLPPMKDENSVLTPEQVQKLGDKLTDADRNEIRKALDKLEE